MSKPSPTSKTQPSATTVAASQDGAACCASVATEGLTASQAEDLAIAFAALADPVRLRLVNLLATNGEVCSCDLQAPLGRSQPTISHHTKVLADAGLIRGDKRGRWVWWSIDTERLHQVRTSLET